MSSARRQNKAAEGGKESIQAAMLADYDPFGGESGHKFFALLPLSTVKWLA
ncbi:MAG: hypothetical protein R3F38_16465 [Gammaproteobacteria bacterium]|jgi:hypothetical protein